MASDETGKYHVLRYDGSHYNYECPTGLMASGPWDSRPKTCNGIGCRRDLVEQSTLEAAIEAARASDAEQLMELRKAGQNALHWFESRDMGRHAPFVVAELRAALNPSHLPKETQSEV